MVTGYNMTEPIQIHTLDTTDTLWSEFYRLPDDIYRDDPNSIKSSLESVKSSVHRLDFKDSQLSLLALRNGKACARMVVRCSRDLCKYKDGPIGLISFFEALNDQQAVANLLQTGRQWLKARGVQRIVGPMDGDTWHKYRFNVGPFEQPPFMAEPYNPAYYAGLWEQFGFKILSKYFSKYVGDVQSILPKMVKYYNRSVQNGFTYRKFRLNDFENELTILYELSVRIFENNYFYSKISLEEFKQLYKDSKSIINESLVWFCQDKEEHTCGFVFSFPNYFEAIKSMKGKSDLFHKLKFVMNKPKADILNIKSLGVTPDHRKSGIGAALMYKAYFEGYNLGFKKANMCLIHEENASAQLDAGEGKIFRNYHLYEYEF